MSVQKINDIKKAVCSKFVEREEIVDALFISLIARQHCLLIGPPGTAKSNLISEVAKHISGINYFQWLLTRFSTPEELFGPVSLKDLENGIYKRNTNGKLPEAHLAFADEIFKANSAILNSLLTLINERIFYNNGGIVHSPLVSIIGASNEYPEEEGLQALFDRFLLRFEIKYIGEDASFISMLKGTSYQKVEPLSLDELANLQMMADMVDIPDDVFTTLVNIKNDLKDEGIIPSDRRFKQSLDLLKAKALLEGRNQVKVTDLLILKNGLWEEVEQQETVNDVVVDHAQDLVQKFIDEFNAEAKELWDYLKKDQDPEVAVEVNGKFKSMISDLTKKMNEYPERANELNEVINRIEKAQQKISEVILGF